MSELDRFPLLYESYSKSSEAAAIGAAIATKLLIVLYKMDTTETERAEGKTYPTGTGIEVKVQLQRSDTGAGVGGKTITFYRKVGTAAYASVGTAVGDSTGFCSKTIALEPGTNTFYGEFAGDAQYAGCEKVAKSFGR